MVQVGAFTTRNDAELAQSALASAGIQSTVTSDDAGGAYPFDLSGAARLLVDEVDADDAAAVLSGQPGAEQEEPPRAPARRPADRGGE